MVIRRTLRAATNNIFPASNESRVEEEKLDLFLAGLGTWEESRSSTKRDQFNGKKRKKQVTKLSHFAFASVAISRLN